MSNWPPSVADFEAYFDRDFVYGSTLDTVKESDVTKAINQAALTFNDGLWATLSERTIAYLYVAAHYLVLNIQGAGGLSAVNYGRGVKSAGGGTIESKSVGSVSVGYAVPDFVRQDPILSQFMRTNYGQEYLQFLTPRLVGNMSVVIGGNSLPDTTPASSLVGYGGSAIAPLTITTVELPAGVQAVAYSQTLAVVGGVSPMTFTLTDGTLPPGLALTTAGVVIGSPTTPGTYYFTVTVTDQRGATATQNYQVAIS